MDGADIRAYQAARDVAMEALSDGQRSRLRPEDREAAAALARAAAEVMKACKAQWA